MRNESRIIKEAKETTRVMGYHRSSHEMLRIYTSDRWKEMTDWAKTIGLEIETSCTWYDVHGASGASAEAIGALLQEVVFKEFPKDLVRWEQDCSISGAECVTQCMTKEFIRNHYPQFKNLFDVYLPKFGMLPNDTCGMHCNIGLGMLGDTDEKRLESARKLFYFVNKNFDLSCMLLNRNRSRVGYCGQMREWTNAKTIDPHNYYSDHGVCFNWGHFYEGSKKARVELRLVGPQKTFAQFRNTMETIFHLISAVKKCSWKDMDSIEKVFKGCNKYVLDRLSKCRTNGLISEELYQRIKATSDTETEYI